MNQPSTKSWTPPTPSIGARVISSLGRSFLGAAGVSLAYFGACFIYVLFHPQDSLMPAFGQAGVLLFVAWALGFAVLLIASSRAWSDRAFTVSGFLATFFGLAILAVFFVRLADEVVAWFHYTPMLIQLQNDKIRNDLDNLQRANDAKLAAIEKERDAGIVRAATEEEKRRIRDLFTQILAREKEDQTKKLAEDKVIVERSLRTDTSPLGMVWYFLSSSASDKPQDAGIGPALWGSIWLGLITVLFAVPVGVGAALYLEEYRSEGWLAKVIQININNLAGVPSVVYGILGGFVFVYFFKVIQDIRPDMAPRNLLGGGLTLGLLTLPMVIVSAQEAIRAVPLSLRQGAYALGATKWQVMWTIVLPMARPGILTGTILALSRAIGEAAPLVLFGALLFVDQSPTLFTRFTALPMQIFGWCDRPPVTDPTGGADPIDMWKYNAALASTVLLIVLLGMNAVAIYVRNRAQRKMRY